MTLRILIFALVLAAPPALLTAQPGPAPASPFAARQDDPAAAAPDEAALKNPAPRGAARPPDVSAMQEPSAFRAST